MSCGFQAWAAIQETIQVQERKEQVLQRGKSSSGYIYQGAQTQLGKYGKTKEGGVCLWSESLIGGSGGECRTCGTSSPKAVCGV